MMAKMIAQTPKTTEMWKAARMLWYRSVAVPKILVFHMCYYSEAKQTRQRIDRRRTCNLYGGEGRKSVDEVSEAERTGKLGWTNHQKQKLSQRSLK